MVAQLDVKLDKKKLTVFFFLKCFGTPIKLLCNELGINLSLSLSLSTLSIFFVKAVILKSYIEDNTLESLEVGL